MADVLTWAEVIEHCSRLHTTRRRPLGPWPEAPPREDARMLDIWIEDVPSNRVEAVVVPTHMHEPGFYVRSPNAAERAWLLRSEQHLQRFRLAVEAGRVTRRG